MQKMKRTFPFLIVVIFTIVTVNAINVSAKKNEILQYTAGGHMLGFEKTGLYVATRSHALRIGFSGTKGVIPEAITDASDSKKAIPLKKVIYPGLWEGINLAYTRTDKDIFESTYYIEPNASVEDIKLVYNVPVETTKNGSLILKFETGYMTESPPVAWQEINNKKVPVMVSFKKLTTYEAGFEVGQYNRELPIIIDPVLAWNTFMGSSGHDEAHGVAVDNFGNVYTTGNSELTWGSPVNVFTGTVDTFVTKHNSKGVLQWNTFLGSAYSSDFGAGVAVDDSGNVYVTGTSGRTWGSPINAFTSHNDGYVAKLSNNGVLQWNTFIGGYGTDEGTSIEIDSYNNVYITGKSDSNWGSPVNAHTGGSYGDAYVVKLNSNGALQWNTFMGAPQTTPGSTSADTATDITIDDSGNVYVTGDSELTWGSPINAHAGGSCDAFVAKLNSNGILQWNTFMGASSDAGHAYDDNAFSIAIDNSGNIYIVGHSYETWGSPINAHSEHMDAFLVKLNNSGARKWNTFIGAQWIDTGKGLSVDGFGNIFIVGSSSYSWGSPINAHDLSDPNYFVAKFNTKGILKWNTFMGSSIFYDSRSGIVLDNSNNLYVFGNSNNAWGTPVNAHTGGSDPFIVKFDNNGSMTWIPLLLLTD